MFHGVIQKTKLAQFFSETRCIAYRSSEVLKCIYSLTLSITRTEALPLLAGTVQGGISNDMMMYWERDTCCLAGLSTTEQQPRRLLTDR